MVVYSCLNSRNFKYLKSILPDFIQLKNSMQFSADEYTRLNPDITILNLETWKTAPQTTLPCTNTTLLWGNKEDNIHDVVAVLENGMSYLPYPNHYQKLECFLITRQEVSIAGNRYREMGIIGNSRAVFELRRTISRFAPCDASVLLQGETGTGKELCARALHSYSKRSGEFIPVNCAAIPETLLESELFGTRKGAYTDSESRTGYMDAAHCGTLFLDEIAELPLKMQSKLLRVLEDKKVTPLGTTRSEELDIRFICASSRDLYEMTETGEFRKDLYYRVNILKIKTPALIDRREDIPLLSNHLLKKSKCLKTIDSEAMLKLLSHPWPGNIRELSAVLQRAAVLSDSSSSIRRQDIHF